MLQPKFYKSPRTFVCACAWEAGLREQVWCSPVVYEGMQAGNSSQLHGRVPICQQGQQGPVGQGAVWALQLAHPLPNEQPGPSPQGSCCLALISNLLQAPQMQAQMQGQVWWVQHGAQ